MSASAICGYRPISAILDEVRQLVGFGEAHVRRQPDVQVEEHMIRRSARANAVASDDAWHGQSRRARGRLRK